MAKQVNATDVKINKLEIYGATGRYDLIPHMLELNIYENIFRPFLSANLVLTDSHNIPYKLPIVGEETVDIDISLAGYAGSSDEKRLSIRPPRLHVNSLRDKYFTKPKTQVFSLHLLSEQYMSSIHSKVSKSYRGKKISSIVDNIYFKYLFDGERGMFFEPTDKSENIIIPNLSPIDAIQWLARRSVSEKGSGVNYLFYETINESYFTSLDTLVSEEPVKTFIFRPRIDDSTGVGFIKENFFKIDKFEFKNQFNKTHHTERGTYSSKLITHDIVKKEISQHEYTGYNEWFALNHCGDFPPLSNSQMEIKSANVNRTSHAPPAIDNNFPTTTERELGKMIDSNVHFYPKHDQLYAKDYDDLYNNNAEEWKLKRGPHLGHFDDGIILILFVSGNSSLRVGQTVILNLPSPETSDKDKKTDVVEDLFLSGKYLVTAIRHIFAQGSISDPKIAYTMQVEVRKDGVEEMVPIREARDREEL
tara:strand:+ start:996 stop:2423 length:1428 start_codon:yes stop_codon:yes gene_type:complete